MLQYVTKRLLWMIPTFLGITVLVFFLLSLSPSDSAQTMLSLQGMEEGGRGYDIAYEREYKKQGLDRPLFYLSIVPNYFPKNFASLASRSERVFYRSKLKERIDHSLLDRYIGYRRSLESRFSDFVPMGVDDLRAFILEKNIDGSEFSSLVEEINASSKSSHYPVLRWHGLNNQYHNWVSGIFGGDFGISSIDGLSVTSKVGSSLIWTLLILLINFVITLLIAVPLAIRNSIKEKARFRKIVERILLVFYSMPMFWLGTLVVVFLTNNYYGIKIFDLGNLRQDASIFQKIIMVMPLALVMTFAELAYFYNVLVANLDDEKNKPYVATAKAKGLTNKNIFRGHVLKNAFVAPITLLLGSIPLAISGALVLEVIFNVPGMGRLMYESILKADYSVVYCIVCLVTLLTLIFSFVSDLVYTKLNPKIVLGDGS